MPQGEPAGDSAGEGDRPHPPLRRPTTGYGIPEDLETPEPVARPDRRIIQATFISALILVVLGVATILLLNRYVYSPESVAGSYLEAVARGDAETALNLLNPDDIEDNNLEGLSDSVLKNAANLPVDIQLVSSERRADGTVEARYSYRIGSNQQQTTFLLQDSGPYWLLFHTWRLTDTALPTVDVEVTGAESVQINGSDVDLRHSNTLPLLYPATYSFGYRGTYMTADSEQLDVTDDSQPDNVVRLNLKATPELAREVSRQVNASLDGCAQQTVLAPADCPFAVENVNQINGDVSWKIIKYPEVTLRRTDNGWTMQSARGRAEATGSETDIVTAKVGRFSLGSDFEYSATVRVSGERVIVSPEF
ncbi:hypothetical protein LWF01_18125 [Saxibacter everestensis]|uniref:DUF4878 domain-containing protein n=1 Tax=Saxibacter everestensis TaxID=2909229 RepID=A0ABY8QSJ1_9MICO|nr:hypothetical protein LWF01_18125 [Brevibacteriaceae bacterium ZFBP1038]